MVISSIITGVSSQFGHKWNPVYQRFCVNMERQRGFVKALHQLPDFQEYVKVSGRSQLKLCGQGLGLCVAVAGAEALWTGARAVCSSGRS